MQDSAEEAAAALDSRSGAEGLVFASPCLPGCFPEQSRDKTAAVAAASPPVALPQPPHALREGEEDRSADGGGRPGGGDWCKLPLSTPPPHGSEGAAPLISLLSQPCFKCLYNPGTQADTSMSFFLLPAIAVSTFLSSYTSILRILLNYDASILEFFF